MDLAIAARPHTPTTVLLIMCVEQEIKTHTQRVESGELVFYGQACPGCGGQEDFRLHDRRRRTFRIVLQGCVKLLGSWILRWRCLGCGKRFTDCPPFAVPHKRYARLPVREKAKEYLGTGASYRKVVQHQGMPILYDDRQGNGISARKDRAPGLAPSTVWRWMSWLGSLENILRQAWRLIRQKAPNSELHREPWPLPAEKHASDGRQQTLQRAMQCLVIEPLFRELFAQEIFPNFATAHGWR